VIDSITIRKMSTRVMVRELRGSISIFEQAVIAFWNGDLITYSINIVYYLS